MKISRNLLFLFMILAVYHPAHAQDAAPAIEINLDILDPVEKYAPPPVELEPYTPPPMFAPSKTSVMPSVPVASVSEEELDAFNAPVPPKRPAVFKASEDFVRRARNEYAQYTKIIEPGGAISAPTPRPLKKSKVYLDPNAPLETQLAQPTPQEVLKAVQDTERSITKREAKSKH